MKIHVTISYIADQKNLDEEIDKLRDGLKPKVSKLRDMEGR